MANLAQIDVVGVGALNLDLIVDWETVAADSRAGVLGSFSLDRERPTQDLDRFLRLVRTISRSGIVRAERGGSAFNTLRALSSMRLGLRLGYVGVAAPSPRRLAEILPGHSLPAARRALEAAGIDQGGVRDGSPPGGLSVSIVRGQTRSLRTLYDAQAAAVLGPCADQLRAYLRRARHIHVTSVLGPGSETLVTDLIESVMDDNSGRTLSVDPGRTWAHAIGNARVSKSAAGRLFELADIIFVNGDELICLGGSADRTAAKLVLERYGRRTRKAKVLVLKNVADTRSFVLRGDEVVEDKAPQQVLPAVRVADPTGAGDVFAAGFLAALLSDRGRIAGGLRLGSAASRCKVQSVGAIGYQNLEQVLLGYRDPAPGKLFVSHCAHDRALARKFVHLMRVAGVASERIFCVAQDSPRQEPRRPFDPEILRALESSVLITMLVTPNYLKSSSCCYDLGASWALGLEQFPLLVPPAPTSDLTDLVRSRVVYRIDSPVGLSALHSRLYELGLIDLPRTTWEDDVTSFLQNTRSYWSSGG